MSRRKQQKPVQMTDSEEESGLNEEEKKHEKEDAAGALMALSNPPVMTSQKSCGPATRKRTRMEMPPEDTSKRIDPPRDRPKGKTCSVCLEQVKNIYELREHMLLHNLHTCTKCLRYFKYKRSFENHRYFCQGVKVRGRPARTNETNGDSEELGHTDRDDTKVCDKVIEQENLVEACKETTSESTMNLGGTDLRNSASTDSNKAPEVPVKRRRGRPPGSTTKLSRPTLVPVPSCPPISKKRSYRSLASVHTDLNMETCPPKSVAVAQSQNPFFDIPIDVTSTTNTHSSCVMHSGSLNSLPGSTSSSTSACCHTPCTSQIFMPSPVVSPYQNPKESSFIWQGIQIQEEKPLVTRMEGINPVTEQHYILYKCCLCGNAFPGITLLASHLMAHTRGTKEHSCQKCGAIFKWRSQLEVHEQVHQVMDSRLAAPATSSCMMLMNSMGLMGSSENLLNPTLACHRPTLLLPTSSVSPGVFYPRSVSPNSAPEDGSMKESVGSSLVASPSPTENLVEANSIVTRANNQGKPAFFQCKFCPKSFDRLFSLQRHERIHTGIKPCFCKLCGKGFSERRNLRHHIIRFHSDGNQRELFRRRPRQRNTNSSLKLVSFLKRTAVRILNSMDQSRFDSEMNEMESSEQNLKLAERQAITKQDNQTEEKQTTVEPVMVVIPTDAPSDVDQTTCVSSNQGSDEEQRELLQDPKRSLIGNRRKGRPFRFANIQNTADEESARLEALCNGKLANFPIDTYIKEEPNIYMDGENGGLCTNILQVTLTEDPVNGIDENNFPSETLPTFKAKLRGHGAFFSSYNPSTTRPKELKVYKSTTTSRLGVVMKPVIRTEACKPQLGPDGKYVYPCSYCFKTFCSTSDLNRHMDFHEDVRPFKCPYCSYYSRTNSQLKVHMMRHQGIKHYLCHICNYNGVTQSDLNRHCKTRTHLLRTRNVCSVCGLGFYTKSLLEEHERMYNHSGSETPAEVKVEPEKNDAGRDASGEDDKRNNNDRCLDSKNSNAEHSNS